MVCTYYLMSDECVRRFVILFFKWILNWFAGGKNFEDMVKEASAVVSEWGVKQLINVSTTQAVYLCLKKKDYVKYFSLKAIDKEVGIGHLMNTVMYVGKELFSKKKRHLIADNITKAQRGLTARWAARLGVLLHSIRNPRPLRPILCSYLFFLHQLSKQCQRKRCATLTDAQTYLNTKTSMNRLCLSVLVIWMYSFVSQTVKAVQFHILVNVTWKKVVL